MKNMFFFLLSFFMLFLQKANAQDSTKVSKWQIQEVFLGTEWGPFGEFEFGGDFHLKHSILMNVGMQFGKKMCILSGYDVSQKNLVFTIGRYTTNEHKWKMQLSYWESLSSREKKTVLSLERVIKIAKQATILPFVELGISGKESKLFQHGFFSIGILCNPKAYLFARKTENHH